MCEAMPRDRRQCSRSGNSTGAKTNRPCCRQHIYAPVWISEDEPGVVAHDPIAELTALVASLVLRLDEQKKLIQKMSDEIIELKHCECCDDY